MLQWMGGSRRKVANSRNSMQKRQKQYFEQRRRQQQQTTGSESYADGINISRQHHYKNRSLDIENLLHLSSLAHEIKSGIPNAIAPDSAEVKEKRNSSDPVEIASVKNLFDASNNHDDKTSKIDDKVEQWKMVMGPELSVIDLLGDYGPSGSAKASPVHEAHVELSVEELGRVGTNTPVHSPQQDNRATRQLDSLRGPAHIPDAFKFDVDAYMQDMDMLPLDDSLEFSGDMKDLRCKRERLPDFQDQIDLDGDYNIMDNSSSDMKKHFQDIEDNKKYLWDATSRFSDEDLLCERSCEASWKNWPCKQGGTSVKFSNSDEQLILDDTFERPQKKNRRNAVRTKDRLNFSVSPRVQPKHQKPQNFHDQISLEMPRCINFSENIIRHCPVDMCFDFRDVNSQQEWSLLPDEDAKDSSSLRSEESCCSRAGDVTNNTRLNTKARQNQNQGHTFGHRHSDEYYGEEDNFFIKTECDSRDDYWQATVENQSKKFTDFSCPSESSSQPSCIFQENVPEDGLLLKEKATFDGMNSEFDSFLKDSDKIRVSSVSNIWNEGPMCKFPYPEISLPNGISPPGSFLYKKFTFHQTSSPTHSEDTPIPSKVDVGLQMPNIVANYKRECLPPYSSDFLEKSWSPDLLAQGDICRKQEIIQNDEPVLGEKMKVDTEHPTINNCFSTEKGEALNYTDISTIGKIEETGYKTQEVTESQGIRSQGDIAMLMKIPDEFRNIITKKLYISSTTSPIPCLNVDQDVAPGERNGTEQDGSYSSHQD